MTATRDSRSLDGIWHFAVDWNNDLDPAELTTSGLPHPVEIAVPASVNDQFADSETRDHVGYWWYQRRVRVPKTWKDQETALHFGSATHHAAVWINGKHVGSFKGGYLPFEFDVTDHVTAGEEFLLTARVDNRLDNSCIPPGEVKVLPDGRRVQGYLHDLYNYTGLHRSVNLVTRSPRHVDDVTISTTHDENSATVNWRIELSEPAVAAGDEIRVSIVDQHTGEAVAEGRGADSSVVIDNPVVWTPGVGGLYDLVITVVSNDGEVLDEYAQHFGVRTVEIRGTDFLINGEPFYFTVFGMHEDHNTLGKGHSNPHMVQDFELLNWIGANSLRTSHYPYSEEFMDYCDRNGIVVLDETPAVGLNWSMAGGILDSDGGETFEDGHVDASTQAQHRREIEGLISRDKNRPAVVMWVIANEPDSAADRARGYFEPLVDLTRDCDPSRPVGYANVMFAPPHEDKINDLFDAILLNRYFGWYLMSGDLTTAEHAMRAELDEWAGNGKPVIYTEFGADTVAGLHSVYDTAFTEDFQVAYLEMCARVFDSSEAVVGEQMWNFADFQTKFGYARVDGNKKGAFTRDRRPKAAARYLQKRWTTKPEALRGQRNPRLRDHT